MGNNGLSTLVGKDGRYKHGLSYHPIYGIWASMIQRCRDKNCKAYKNYGGRGIKVCERWKKLKNFYQDMGDRPAGKSLDRKNNDGNYEPSNCAWRSRKEQATNTRRNHWITYKGETKTLTQWAEQMGVLVFALSKRFRRGWDLERIFNQPFRQQRRVNT